MIACTRTYITVEVVGATEDKVEVEVGLEEDKGNEAAEHRSLQGRTVTLMTTVHTVVRNVVRQDLHKTMKQLSPT